jgi:CBS domain-containing protein
MTPQVITIDSDAPISEAIHRMLQHRVSGLPVVDPGGNLVGIVTESDFLRRPEDDTEKHRSRWLEFILGPGRLAAEYMHTHGRKVSEVMTPSPATVVEHTPVSAIVNLMEKRRINRVPVVRGTQVVGIVSRANLLQLLGRLAAEAKPTSKSDSDIRAAILTELQKQPWAPAVNVIVRDHIVELKGAILDERQRDALKVIAENVSGVKEVRDHLIWVEQAWGM